MGISIDAGSVHADTARMDIREVVRRLNDALGGTLVAALAGARDPKASYKWGREHGPTPRDEVVKRLQLAHRAWMVVSTSEGGDVARMWFLGANPWLDEVSPVEAISQDRAKEVMDAAFAMAEDRFAG